MDWLFPQSFQNDDQWDPDRPEWLFWMNCIESLSKKESVISEFSRMCQWAAASESDSLAHSLQTTGLRRNLHWKRNCQPHLAIVPPCLLTTVLNYSFYGTDPNDSVHLNELFCPPLTDGGPMKRRYGFSCEPQHTVWISASFSWAVAPPAVGHGETLFGCSWALKEIRSSGIYLKNFMNVDIFCICCSSNDSKLNDYQHNPSLSRKTNTPEKDMTALGCSDVFSSLKCTKFESVATCLDLGF